MPSNDNAGAVKQYLRHCQLCGFEVESPCDSRSRLKNCEKQIKNKLHGGISSDFVRAVTRGRRVLTYVPVTSAELKALLK
jgi:hypothetical protein